MVATWILAACLAVDGPAPRDAYEEAKAKAGRDADSQVKLALWCEAHGLTSERIEHLARAIAVDPSNAAARGLLGMVSEDGRWKQADESARRLREDQARMTLLADYARRRDEAPRTAEGQWKLALWCDENGLKDEARAHLTTVVRLEPNRDAAWKRLGCKKVDGVWMTDEQVAQRRRDRDVQEKADRQWKPKLERLRSVHRRADLSPRSSEELAAVADPRAVPMILKVFGKDPADAARLVQLLGQVDSPQASRALAALSLFGASDEIRRTASETLRRRDPREYADVLIGMMRDPIKYHAKPVQGPGTVGELTITGKDRDFRRLYRTPEAPQAQPGDHLAGHDEFGMPVIDRPLGPGFRAPHVGLDVVLPGAQPIPPQISQRYALEAQAAKDPNSRPLAGSGLTPQAQALGAMLSSVGQDSNRIVTGLLESITPNSYVDHNGVDHAMLQYYAEHGDDAQKIAVHEYLRKATNNPEFQFDLQPHARIPVGRMQFEAQRAAMTAQERLETDVAEIEARNAPILELNARASTVLKEATGQDLGEAREAWRDWWVDQLGFRTDLGVNTRTRPAVTQEIDVAAAPVPIETGFTVLGYQRVSCFGAGTLVRTISGPRPIEMLKVGDRVLAQDEATGALTYQPILTVHHNPPSKTLEVNLGRDTIVSSEFHRFWVAGQGWKMARDLKPGDPIRTLEGTARVSSIEPGKTQPVFNMDVAGKRTFFVGQTAALVHDNTVPNFRATPFDALPELAQGKP